MKEFRRRARAALATVALALAAGCSDSRRPELFPAGGTLLIDGQPAANARIALHPLGVPSGSLCRPVTVAGADGTYRMTTCANGDGAPAGEYAVTVVWPDPALPVDECNEVLLHDLLQGTYADPATTPLRVKIETGINELRLRVCQPGSWSTPRKRTNGD